MEIVNESSTSPLVQDNQIKSPRKNKFNSNEYNNVYEIFDVTTSNKFKNKEYLLKFSNQNNLKFFKDGLTVKYSGKGYAVIDYGTVQTNTPINQIDPIFYFEIEILDEGGKKDITIGFSDKETILNKQCGTVSKSYGYNGDGNKYHIEKEAFGPKFKEKDIIGCGLYFAKKSIFYTYNGKFLGYAFKNIDMSGVYYPTISLHSLNECVVANFGRNNYCFDIEDFYINHSMDKIKDIITKKIKLDQVDYIIREYLVHSGYQETFNAMELERTKNEEYRKEPTALERKVSENTIQETQGNRMDLDNDDENNAKIGKNPKEGVSDVNCIPMATHKEPDVLLNMNFLQERKIIKKMIIEKEYDSALEYFNKQFIDYLTKKEVNYKKIILCFHTLKYFEKLRENDIGTAFEILNSFDKSYWSKDIKICLYDTNEKIEEMTIEGLSALLCFQNTSDSDGNYYFSEKQSEFIGNQINNLILELADLSNGSVLEKILKQQKFIDYSYTNMTNCPKEIINIKIN